MFSRIVTAVLAGSIALAAILWREPWGIIVLSVLIFLLAGAEAAHLVGVSPWGLLAFIPLIPAFGMPESLSNPFNLSILWVPALVGLLVWSPKRMWSSPGIVIWPAAGLASGLLLQPQFFSESASFAPNLLLLALLPLWVGDSLAYFVGKAIGRHKMAPSISPNKTWEGAAANLLGCLGAAYGIGAWLGVPLAASIAVGLTTGILGQVGDLLQSRLKRLANVKDSGTILPGHGGVLDRLDSFLFSSYPSLLALYLLAPELFHVKQWPW
ncbi:MAG: phosphatidate cytidylyltransferase [Fimbriimonadaceae bacterium]